ncbi:MAG: GNAT family N-acetyltransferase [Myxococcota bacterium]
MSEEIVLGPARRSEATALAEMSRALIEDGLRWRWQPRSLARLIMSDKHEVVVARRGDEIVGFGAMEFPPEGSAAHLMLLAVAPERRLGGLGKRLLGYLEAMALELGMDTIELEVRSKNLTAREFYDATGYREVTHVPGYYDGRETAVRMRRMLRAD